MEPIERRVPPEVNRGLAFLIIGEALCEFSLAGEKSGPTLLSLRSTFGYAAFNSLKRQQLDMLTFYLTRGSAHNGY